MSSGVIKVLFFENSASDARSSIETLEGESSNQFTVINVPRFQVSPRNLVELHVKALKEKTDRMEISKVEAMVRKGRWILPHMGYLAENYRQACLAAGQPSTSVAGKIPNDCRRRG